jgi:parvulin-like peptidyl-prolyl isomerase
VEDPESRRRAADALAVQKLREILVAREVDPASDEIREEVDRRLEEEAGEARVVLRSLLLESEEQAQKVYRDIRRRRLTFGEAVVQHGTQPGQGLPVEMELETLPQEVRDGIAELRPGRTAPPLVLHGDVYLFHLDRRSGSADRQRRAELLAEILAERRRGVLERVLAELREEKRLRLQQRALPFRYVYNQES